MKSPNITKIPLVLLLVCALLLAFIVVKSFSKNNTVTGNTRSESYVNGVLYQESAEVAALYLQSFELATLKLNKAIEDNGGSAEGLCIVTDIDATLMDDSPYFVGALLNLEGRKSEGQEAWNNHDWLGYYAAIATEAVKPVPGAVEFIKYADAIGVKIFYITNRPYYELDLTVKQLYKNGFIDETVLEAYSGLDELQEYHEYGDTDSIKAKINASGKFIIDDAYFTLANDYRIQVEGTEFSSDKAARRANVEKALGENEKVVLYMGDSINDMISAKESDYTDLTLEQSAAFSKSKGNAARTEAARSLDWADKWGTEFVVMPNSVYGDWVKATWYGQGIDDAGEIDAIINQFLSYSYLNSETWYNGPSPTGNNIQ